MSLSNSWKCKLVSFTSALQSYRSLSLILDPRNYWSDHHGWDLGGRGRDQTLQNVEEEGGGESHHHPHGPHHQPLSPSHGHERAGGGLPPPADTGGAAAAAPQTDDLSHQPYRHRTTDPSDVGDAAAERKVSPPLPPTSPNISLLNFSKSYEAAVRRASLQLGDERVSHHNDDEERSR